MGRLDNFGDTGGQVGMSAERRPAASPVVAPDDRRIDGLFMTDFLTFQKLSPHFCSENHRGAFLLSRAPIIRLQK